MNLNQLRFAQAVAQYGSFTDAANACCVTQPTLSNSIGLLEDELGQKLFVRTTRKVELSPFGVHILPFIERLLSAQSALLTESKSFSAQHHGEIKIGISPLVSTHLLSLIIDPFRAANPDISLVLREMNMMDLNRMLEDGLLDFVFGVANEYQGNWRSMLLYEEPLLFIPCGNVWQTESKVKSVQFADIANETFLMVPDACGLSRAIRTLFRQHRKKLNAYPGEAMSYRILEEWASQGLGAVILPKSTVTKNSKINYPIYDRHQQPVRIGFQACWSQNGEASYLDAFLKHLDQFVPAMILQEAQLNGGKLSKDPS